MISMVSYSKLDKSKLFCSLILSLIIILTAMLVVSALGSKYIILTYIGTYSISPILYLASPKVDVILLEVLNIIFIVTLFELTRRAVSRVEVCIVLTYLGIISIVLANHLFYESPYVNNVIVAIIETTISIMFFVYLTKVRKALSFKAVLCWTLRFTALALFIVELLGLIYQTLLCLGVDLPIIRAFRFYDMLILYAFHLLNPLLLLLFLFSWTLLPLIGKVRAELREINIKTGVKIIDHVLNKHIEIIGLAIGLFYATLLGSVPYLPWLNPSGRYVGVDAVTRYHPHLTRMVRGEGLSFALSSDRPLFYAVTYYLAKYFGVVPVVKAMPLACSVMFTIATFFLARVLFNNKWLVALATVLTPASINTTMAIFAGLYANWTAFALVFFSISLILKSEERMYLLPLGIILLFATAGVHPYQWAVVVITLILYTVMQLGNVIRRRKVSKLFIVCLLTILITLAFTAFIIFAFKDIRRVFRSYSRSLPQAFYKRLMSLSYFDEKWWRGMLFFTYNYGIGAFINVPAHVLSTLGFLRYKFKYDKLLIAWLVGVSALAFIIPYNRYMYVLPFHLYLALGVYAVFDFFKKVDHKVALVIMLILVFVQLNYATRYILWVARTLF